MINFVLVGQPQHVCEVQIVHAQMLTARKGLPGHVVYGCVRNGGELLECVGLEDRETRGHGLETRRLARRLTIEQLLQHPWVIQGGRPGIARRYLTEADLTAGLRAAVFATILQQQVAAGDQKAWVSERRDKARKLREKGTYRSSMLDGELLGRAFGAFDADAKGFIDEADLLV